MESQAAEADPPGGDEEEEGGQPEREKADERAERRLRTAARPRAHVVYHRGEQWGEEVVEDGHLADGQHLHQALGPPVAESSVNNVLPLTQPVIKKKYKETM